MLLAFSTHTDIKWLGSVPVRFLILANIDFKMLLLFTVLHASASCFFNFNLETCFPLSMLIISYLSEYKT